MTLIALRCPTCSAPVDASNAASIQCRYCGAALRPAPSTQTRTVYALFIERVGPSNRARIAELLRTVVGLAPEEALRLVTSAPCEVAVFDEEIRAHVVRDALIDGGVGARLEERQVIVPPPVVLPDRAVHLVAMGNDKVAVMKVVRAHLDVGLVDAKQLVERAPCVLVDALEGARAAAFADALTAAGANARLA